MKPFRALKACHLPVFVESRKLLASRKSISGPKGGREGVGSVGVSLEDVLGCPWKLLTIVSKLVYNLVTGRKQPTYKGVIIHLLSTMDIPVCIYI